MKRNSRLNTEQVIKNAAKEAVKECLNELEKKSKNNAFRNTKRLLECYNDLKAHIEHSVASLEDMEKDDEYNLDILQDEPDILISSIRRSRCRTIIMIAHIDSALKQLFAKASNDDKVYKFRMMEAVYFKGDEFGSVAEEYHCSESTARRAVNDMIRELSIMLFGSGGLVLE